MANGEQSSETSGDNIDDFVAPNVRMINTKSKQVVLAEIGKPRKRANKSRLRDVLMVWNSPVLVHESHYLLLSFNLKEVAIGVLDTYIGGQDAIEKYGDKIDFIKQLIIYWLDIRRLHAKKKKKQYASLKPHVVGIPLIDGTSKMAYGILTMRHMEKYMGAPNHGWEEEMTSKDPKSAVRNMRVKYLHKLMMWEKNEFKYVLTEAMDKYRNSLGKLMPVLVTIK